jgi:localization factor PodJL
LLSSASENSAGAAIQPERAAEDLKDLEAAARHGDSEAQFRIGTRFLSDGAFSNGGAATAARWLAKAAGQGHLEAQFMLASLYERGAGVAKDENQAISLYRKAANAGHIRAMHNLGVLLSAHESPQDYSEAAVWFARAAQAGLADSQYNLALLYERGLGVEQDLSRAYLWYRAAGRGGDKEAARQAERLKRALPAGAGGTQASSWRPSLEDRPKAPDWSGGRG